MLPKAKELNDKYVNENSKEVFDVCNNHGCNSYLKEIESILGINKEGQGTQ